MMRARTVVTIAGPNEPTGAEIRKFNPGTLQSDREIVDQFVVRRRELDTVLEILRGNIGSASCQHILAVAPRGRGKTMLLARVAAELRTNVEFSTFLLPVRFMEESHEMTNVADFWLETALRRILGWRRSCGRRTHPCASVGANERFTTTPAPPCSTLRTVSAENWY